jgi:hypothetical protein
VSRVQTRCETCDFSVAVAAQYGSLGRRLWTRRTRMYKPRSGGRIFRHYVARALWLSASHGLRPRLRSFAATAAENHNFSQSHFSEDILLYWDTL